MFIKSLFVMIFLRGFSASVSCQGFVFCKNFKIMECTINKFITDIIQVWQKVLTHFILIILKVLPQVMTYQNTY